MALIRWQGGWDIHGDQQDGKANEVFFDFAKVWKPKIRICGGDLFDFRPLRKGASEDERHESLKDDFKAGSDWFNRFKPTVFLRGNHDERLWELAETGKGAVGDFAQEGVEKIKRMVDFHKCQMLPYHKMLGVYMLGNKAALHGFHSGINAARQTALIYGDSLFGHVHAVETATIPGLRRRVARSVGCLCLLDLPYASRTPSTLRQGHGFPYGLLDDRTGETQTFQAEPINGKWMLPTEFTNL